MTLSPRQVGSHARRRQHRDVDPETRCRCCGLMHALPHGSTREELDDVFHEFVHDSFHDSFHDPFHDLSHDLFHDLFQEMVLGVVTRRAVHALRAD